MTRLKWTDVQGARDASAPVSAAVSGPASGPAADLAYVAAVEAACLRAAVGVLRRRGTVTHFGID